MTREIMVWADGEPSTEPRQFGILRAEATRGSETFSFEYDRSWLENPPTLVLDPELQYFAGPQYVRESNRSNFGIFLDSSPDRWGRTLMNRREAILARKEKRAPRRLQESDYLLGVHDTQRMGALRFRLGEGEAFLGDEMELEAPPWSSLRELENASWKIQDDTREDREDTIRWLNLLIAPGSSLGGARPKAGVQDPGGDLWIAKFPGRNDERDMGSWEWVAWILARSSGIEVPSAKRMQIGRSHHTFLTKRFDRVDGSSGAKRKHFASAMTLLGRADGDNSRSGASYLELAELISEVGGEPQQDLEQLWRRIVFSILVRNTDDHLRNHGFLLTSRGWRLSAAFDLNPDPSGSGLSLNIDEGNNDLDLDLAMDVAEFFRTEKDRAFEIQKEIREAVSQWRRCSEKAGLPKGEIQRMEHCFSA